MRPRTGLKPLLLFCSYSHKDEELREQLGKHLSSLKRQGYIQEWHDRKIGAGREWEREIKENLETAKIILLLVSSDFLASDYCYDKEMMRALEKHQAGEARVIPIHVRQVDWSGSPFSHLQAFPKNAKAVTSWANQDEAWTDVVKAIREAVEKMQAKAVQLSLPLPSRASSLLPPETSAVLAILQHCPDAVPVEVLSAAISYSVQDLDKLLFPLLGREIVQSKDGLYSIGIPSDLLSPADVKNILSRTLDELLAFIDLHRKDKTARLQVMNAVKLARECSATHPRSVAHVFRILDKFLKRRGDKRLVFDIANNLSIDAAQRALRNEEVVKDEAHALICGRSWVLQRVGRFAEAQVAAEKSLQLGQDIGWDLNTAYCKKCMGRLFRLQAEKEQGGQKATLLAQSVESLNEGIERFGKLGDFGPTHPEVGDCYSLLGRTYLVAGRFREADAAVQKAHNLISDQGSKDYLDLTILSGDLQVAQGNRQMAASFYDTALKLKEHDDPEVSELRARAYMARARNREAMNDKRGALSDYGNAFVLYQQLGEREEAAKAQWEQFRLKDQVPREALPLLQAEERYTVRVAALLLHQEQSGARRSTVLAQRQTASKTYWQQLIRDARSQVAREEQEW